MRKYLTSGAQLFRALTAAEPFAGMLLLAVAGLAIVAANSPLAEPYEALFHHRLAWSPIPKLDTLHLWVNDAVMAVFFFAVGLEVKREILDGNLADARTRRLPVLAAAAGMAAPAAVYLLIAGKAPGLVNGWAIPAATDIAFAMGVIGLLGRRVPAELRLFLLTVAIVDDIGAVLVIALFYTAALDVAWLGAALAVFAVLMALNRIGVKQAWPFLLGALALWFCVLHSGVHATIAGVVAAFAVPLRGGLLERIEHRLLGWTAFVVVPLFGFANAGVSLAGIGPAQLLAPLPLAIGAGLVVGKQAGIFACILLCERLGIARRPEGASWAQVWGTALLCGIGFTMSLFIAELAFPLHRALVEEAKLGILGGSLVSAVLGYAVLRLSHSSPNRGVGSRAGD